MSYLQKLKSLLLLLCIAVTAKAQLTNGNVYNLVNVRNNTKSLVVLSQSDLSIATTDVTAAEQLWYVEEVSSGVFALRNLYSGNYLHSPNVQSNTKWTLVNRMDESSRFTCTKAGDGYAFALRAANTTDNGLYMHYGAGTDRIVCWDANSGTTASHWMINKVEKTATIQELIDNFPNVEAYQVYLNTLFADKACTSLNDTYKSMSVETLKTQEAYVGLPEALQQMVLKVRNGDGSWGESNYDGSKSPWAASYAKKYRVQLYEPYNEPECAASALGLNAHTNINNPTGIFANDKEVLYVMVGGEIEDGASLYLASYRGNGNLGGYSDGVELKQGLNVVASSGEGNNYCINYVVHTFDTSKGRGNKAKARKLSDYADLKIHIEGGYINGYYNKVGDELYVGEDGGQGDTAADWDYIEQRATQTTVTILGKYITLQFPLHDAIDSDGHTQKGMSYYLDQVSVEDVINEWDNVMLWERLVLGVLDKETTQAEAKKSPYSDKDYVFEYIGDDNGGFESDYGDYYNVHGLSLGIPNSYMYGSWNHCGYNYGTMPSIMVDMLTNAGSHWGPGHEIGHQHQNLLTVNGLTEVTNNLFANVVLWYFGETTSRVNGTDGSLSNVLAAYNTEGSDFFTNNIWALTHMYYKLFLYYHVLGHNTKFYPTLFEMLRQDPMSGGYEQNGATSLLHFYKKCCLASGDDLTEFFRAYGFFSVMDNRLVGDYSNSVYTTTQVDIDAAIEEVKDLGYDENIAVLFINDATGETIKSHKGDNLTLYGETTVCAETGSYASFAANAAPDYTYSVSGTTVTMEGTGGTGFAIFNEKGEIIAFSDKKTFEISSECAVAIASGKAEIKSVKADNTPVEAVDVMDTNDAEAKYMALGELLDAAKTVTNLADATGTKVGYYRSDLLTDLQDAYEKAKTVYDNETVASYNAVYDVLYQEYANVVNDDFARIGIIEGNAYRLTNKVYTGLSMSVNANDKMLGENTVDANDAQKWYFEASNSRGRYYLKNKSTGKYPGDVYTSAVLDVNKTEDTKGQENGAYAYELRDMGNGYWALVGRTGLHCASSQDYNVVGWGTDADATLWNIIAVEVDQNAENLYKLQNLIEKTEVLMDEVGHIEREYVALPLTEDNYYTNAQCKNTSYGDQFTSYSVLCDNNPETYLHTDYSDSAPNEDHYIRIDVGSGDELKEFCLSYRTRYSGNLCAPTKMAIEVSNDATTWVTLRDITSGLPTTGNTIYTAEDLGDGSAYQYVRVRVYYNSTDQQKNGHYYFIMSELGLSTANYVATLNEGYTSIASSTLLEAYYALQSAQEQITKENVEEYENAYNGLNSKYAALLSARNDAENATFQAKKTELQTWINKLNGFFGDNECGTVTPVDATSVTLSTTNSSDAYYLTGGPGDASEGRIDNLLKDDVTSYYVSNWSAQTEAPYLQVRLPEGKKLSEFTFTFTSRDGGKAPTPTEIVVSGSNDGATFTPIKTFTKENDGFPEAANTDNKDAGKAVTWNSPTITASTAYQYLRFTVTKSYRPTGGETDANGFYHYSISKFGLGTPSGYNITLGANAGGVTEELLLESYNVVATANATFNIATTEAQLQKAIDKLQAQCNALEEAKNAAIDFTISSNIAGGGVIYNEVEYTSTLSAPSTPTTGELTAKSVDGYVAKSITINGTEISIIYNKVYTIKVTGGRGNGGVTYNGTTYANGETFDVLASSFDESQLEANIPDGYKLKGNITVDENGIISVAFSAIPLVDTEKYYTFECLSSEAHKTERFIRDNGKVINGHSAEGSLFRFEAADDDNGYYIKSYVTDKYINHTTDGSNKVYASGEKNTIWTMAVPSHTLAARTLTVGNNLYLNNNGSDCTDNSCTNLQSMDHTQHGGAPGSGNACSLWTISEGTPLDMTDLKNLIDATNNLIISCYQNGNIDGELVYFNSVYVTADVMTDIKTAVANAQAKYDAGRATTQGEYNAALTALQTANATLASNISLAQTEASDRLTSREALREKIEALRDVIAQCGVIEWGRYPIGRVSVPLTVADFSTNAQEKSEGPIENLLKDDETFFHSSWQTRAGAAHYIQVDLGEGKTLQEFVFGYTTRNVGPHPYIIVVSGSNDKAGSFEEIKVFNSGLPNTGSTSWEASAPIVSSQPYRYLRFTVKKSSDSHDNGEYFFAMSRFELKTIAYSENEDYYVKSLNPNGSVTEEQLLDAYRTMIAAGKLDNVNTTKTELDAKIEELQTLCTTLATDRDNLKLPVELTTDIKNPVLYTFKSQRGDDMALQYDPSANHMFSITNTSLGSVKQMFYFTMGDTRTQVFVHPFVAGEQVLAANNTDDGAAKVFAAINPAESMARQWTFESETIDGTTWYSLKCVGTNYFSHHGGGTNKMGFYGHKDEGSRFQFSEVDESTIEGSSAYHSLKVYYDEVTKVKSAEIMGGNNPGYYPEEQANAYNEAYATATSLLTGEEASYEANFAAYNALKVANEALVLNMPEVGKYYTIASACSDHRSGQLMYATSENAMVFSREMTSVKPEALWTFTSDGYLENLQTGCSVSTASTGGAKHKLGESPKKMDIKSISVDGQVLLTPNGGQPLHAQDNGSVVVGWGAYDAGSASAWRIVEVEDMSQVKHPVSITQYEHAGLYLNYPVTIPDGVKAYYLDGKKITIDNGVGSLNLTKIEDDVIPAKTAVILYAPHGNQTVGYDFVYTEAQGGEYNNLLTGSAYQTFREAQANHNYYVFGQKGGEIGLYKNAVKYSEDAMEVGEANGTHYKMSANKILFDWDSSTHQVSSFRFRMGGQTTGMEDEVVEDNVIIYDLYGRRILEVITSGLYIVNGEKRYIQVR